MKKGLVGIGDGIMKNDWKEQEIQKIRKHKIEQNKNEYMKDYHYRKLEINYKL